MNAFELGVLPEPAPQVDMLTLKAAVKSLRADINMILEVRVPESETSSAEPDEDIVMEALFTTSYIPPLPRETAKRLKFRMRMRLEHGKRSVMRWKLR